MRSFGPEPFTRDRSTPSSRANARTEGEACALLKLALSIGEDAAVAVRAELVEAGTAGVVRPSTGSGRAGCPGSARTEAGAAAAPAASSSRITVPSLTLSPSFTLSSVTVPALGAGTSIAAFSDSTEISESSALTTSPALTKISMIGTSLKSPMSGTLTAVVVAAPTGALAAAAAAGGAGAGAGAGEDAAGAAAAVLAAGAGVPAASSSRMTLPSWTLSPTLTFSSFTTP